MKTLVNKLTPRSIKNLFHFCLSFIATAYYGFPAKKLNVIGVTGTDGKTTTSTIIYEMLKTAGKKVALVSTVAAYIGEKEIDTGFHVTSPDARMLQKLLKKISEKNYKYVVLEVTSHGLDQHRFLGANIRTAVLTNITHEHLDYHGTYNNYVKAKAKIFKNATVAIINKTDGSFTKIKKFINKPTKIIAYDLKSTPLVVRRQVTDRFPEIYNQLNATAAYLAAKHLGVNDKDAMRAIKNFAGVPGRMEEIKNRKGIRIIVDFAHTPNALEKVLETLVKQKSREGRLISIFGCASERDDAKRPMMAEISTRIADVSVFTAEDPRYEDINKILNEMASGVKRKATEVKIEDIPHLSDKKHIFLKIPERGEAVFNAINKVAKKGDTVVICGKGHEKSMAYFGVEYPWSDRKAVGMALEGKVLKINRK